MRILKGILGVWYSLGFTAVFLFSAMWPAFRPEDDLGEVNEDDEA